MSADEISESETEEELIEIIPPPIALSQDIMPQCLSTLEKAGNGLSYSYVRFRAKSRNLTDINYLKNFTNLRYVDISHNRLTDLNPLSHITFLLSVKADSNLLTNGIKKEMKYLQFMDVSKNKFISMQGLYHPELEILHFKFNKLKVTTILHPDRLSRLHTLELRGNKLETTSGFNLPHLKHLYLAHNRIKQLQGLDSLTQLTLLHLRQNEISTLDGFNNKMAKLSYLNLRNNKLTDFNELVNLQCLPALRQLIILENQLEEGLDELAILVLMHIPSLSRIDKVTVTNKDKRDAKKKWQYQLAQAEQLQADQNYEDEDEDADEGH